MLNWKPVIYTEHGSRWGCVITFFSADGHGSLTPQTHFQECPVYMANWAHTWVMFATSAVPGDVNVVLLWVCCVLVSNFIIRPLESNSISLA